MKKADRFKALPRETLKQQRRMMSVLRMAEVNGVSESLVRKVLQSHGIRGLRSDAKLTESIVREMRSQAARGQSQVSLANEYEVSKSTVNRVINRIDWKWVR